MKIGNIELTKEMLPSYEIGKQYPTRRYQFMQDTLNGALQQQAVMAMQQQQNAQQQPTPNAPQGAAQ